MDQSSNRENKKLLASIAKSLNLIQGITASDRSDGDFAVIEIVKNRKKGRVVVIADANPSIDVGHLSMEKLQWKTHSTSFPTTMKKLVTNLNTSADANTFVYAIGETYKIKPEKLIITENRVLYSKPYVVDFMALKKFVAAFRLKKLATITAVNSEPLIKEMERKYDYIQVGDNFLSISRSNPLGLSCDRISLRGKYEVHWSLKQSHYEIVVSYQVDAIKNTSSSSFKPLTGKRNPLLV